jgi:hypothetical protein
MTPNGGIFGGDGAWLNPYEYDGERQVDPMACVAAALSTAIIQASLDCGRFDQSRQERILRLVGRMPDGAIRYVDAVAWLRAQDFGIPLEFGLVIAGGPARPLASLRVRRGTAFVANLAAPFGPGHAVAIVSNQPGRIFDPADGGWRTPTAADEERWVAGSCLLLVVRGQP